MPIGRCLVSDLGRACHTARLALAGRAVPVHTLGELRERHMGALQRVPLADCVADGRRERYLLRWDEGPPGGESRSHAVRRALAALRHWDDGTPTLVVGHGSVLRGVVAMFDGVPPHELHTLPPTPNATPLRRSGPVPRLP